MFFGLIVCVGCCWLGLQVAGPLKEAGRLKAENDILERQLRTKNMSNEAERKQVQAIRTEYGKVVAARSRGYMYKNEHPLHVRSDSSQ